MRTVYIGSRTTAARGGRGKGIAVYSVLDNGAWELRQVAEQINPSYLCRDRTEKYLYAVHGDCSEISSYAIQPDGTISYLGTETTGGTNPVHVCADVSNRWLFVANLQTGSVSVLQRLADGRTSAPVHQYFIAGNGGPGYVSHPHQVQPDVTGNYLIVSAQGRAQGLGQVDVFKIDHAAGTLQLMDTVRARAIAEPRHCVFDPTGAVCYGVNEKDYSVTQYAFSSGKLTPVRIVSTLFPDQVAEGWASGIAILPSGKILFTSDRKQDRISVFQVSEQDGFLTLMDSIPSGGRQPRFICIGPEGQSLIVANELSDTIYEIPVDEAACILGEPILRAKTGSPVCVAFSRTTT